MYKLEKLKMSVVVNLKASELRKRGYNNFQEWNSKSHTLYIGRFNKFLGISASKWGNPFKLSEYDRNTCLNLYEDYVRNTPDLINNINDLRGKELGCWCKPEGCHGDILIKLLNENK